MKSKKNKVRGGLTRKEYYNLGKKITLGLVAATLLMDGTALANPITNEINDQVAGPEYGKHVQSDNVAGGTLDITETGIVGTEFAPSAAYGGYTDNGNTYDGVDWSEHNHEYSNSLLVYGGLWGDGYGGYTEHGSAEHNYAYVSEEAKVHGKLYGGYSESGDAYTNVLAVYGHTYDDLYGGRAEHGNVDTNDIQIEYGGVVNADHVYGGYSAEGTVNENIVHVHGSINGKDSQSSGIYGGYSEFGDVTENYMHVAMDSSIKNIDGIYGGATLHNAAINNHASVLADISDVSKIIGGISYDGQATSNIVEIAGTVKASAGKTLEVVGGYSTEGNVTHNKANVNGNVTGKVIGGYTASGNSSNNSVHISGHGVVTGQVYGGQAHGDNTHVQENTVNVEGNVTGQVIGGEAVGDGSVLDNTVTVSGKITGSVAGGKVDANSVATGNGVAIGNVVTVGKNGVVDGTAFGAVVEEGATAGEADAGNKVLVSGGTVTDAIGAVSAEKTYEDVNGVKHTVIGTGDLQYNEVVVESGKVENKAIGAISSSNDSATHLDNNSVTVKNGEVSVPVGAETDGAVSANLNHVDIEGGKVDKAYGAIAKSNGSLTNNSVTISQGDIHATPNPAPKTEVRNATGGWSFSDTITAIEGNSVTINGGAVTGQLAGGKYLGKGNTKVSNNTVTVNGGEFNQYDPAFSRDIAAAGAISTGSGKVSDNYVTVNSHNVNISGVAGAMSEKGELSKNHVNVQDGTVDRAYGAISDGAASAKGNYVDIIGTTTKVTGAVGAIGSKEDGSDYVDNYVTVNTGKDAKVDEAVGAITYGYGDVSENHVTVSAGTVESAIGAVSFYEEDEEAALPNNVNVHNNTTNVLGGKVTYANGAEIRGTGTADDNHVNVTDGEVKYASGAIGYTEKAGELTNNVVTVNSANSNVTGEAAGAVSMSNKLMSKNHVTVNAGTVESAVGVVSYSDSTNALLEENIVEITGGKTTTAQGAVVHGAATAINNEVNVIAGTVDKAIGAVDHGNGTLIGNAANVNGNGSGLTVDIIDAIGAWSDGTGTLKGNSANINADVKVENAIGAEIVGDATAEGNVVNVDEGTVASAIGAFSGVEQGSSAQVHGALINNVVKIGDVDDANSNPTVYNAVGAVSKSSEKLSGNTVIVNKGMITSDPGEQDSGRLIGAYYAGTGNSTVTDNAVIIKGGDIEKGTEVVGAKSSGSGHVSGNSVILENQNAVIDKVVGADVAGEALVEGNTVNVNAGTVEYAAGASVTDKATANKNEVNIKAGEVKTATGASVLGQADAIENKVIIAAGKVDMAIGAEGKFNEKSLFSKNAVQVKGGTVGEAIGTKTEASDILNSEVVVIGGTVTDSIYGGASNTGDVIGSKILLSGGRVEGTVYGGASDSGIVRDNIITLEGKVDVSNANLAGYDDKGNVSGRHSGNTLNITDKWTGGAGGRTAKSIANFDNINIGNVEWGTPAITVDELHLDNTNIHVNYLSAKGIKKRSDLYNGTGATIIKANTVEGELDPKSKIDRVDFGVSFTATDVPINLNHVSGEATFDAGQLIVNEQTQVIAESRTVSTALINQAGDLMADALRAMSRSTSIEGTLYGEKSFAAIHGNSSKYKTGSHVKVNGWSGIAGVGSTMDNGITWGVFLETGGGNYTTHNEIYGFDITGDGKANYTGGGVAFRQDLNDGLYYDAGFRVGTLKNELKDALHGPMGFYGYDVSTTYYGLHLGVGKVFQSDPDNSVEVYGRYFYTRHGGKDFDIAGDQFSFDSVNSNRLKLGVMMENKLDDRLKLRYGLGWEYEFGGKAGSSTWGYDLTSPSLKGSSISYDLGLSYSTSDNSSLELNVSGHSGKRQGISGSVMFNVTF